MLIANLTSIVYLRSSLIAAAANLSLKLFCSNNPVFLSSSNRYYVLPTVAAKNLDH